MIALARLLLGGLRALVAVVACALMAYMVVAVGAQVISRYVFSFSIAWASETATVAQIWMVLLGAGIAMRQGMHVGVDLLLQALPRPFAAALNVAVLVLGVFFLAVVVYGSFRLLKVGSIQKMPVIGIKMYWAYLVVPLGAAYFALEFVIAMAGRLGRGATPQSTASP